MSGRYSFDPACKELALHFLGVGDSVPARDIFDLSQAIQDAVEMWFVGRDAGTLPSDENVSNCIPIDGEQH